MDSPLAVAFGVSHVLMGEDEIQISNLSGQRTSLAAHGVIVRAVLDKFGEPNRPEAVISRLAGEGHSEEAARSVIAFLSDRGYLTESEKAQPREPLLRLIEASQPQNILQQASVSERLSFGTVAVEGTGLLAEIAASIAGDLGLGAVETGQPSAALVDGLCEDDLLIVCRDFDDFKGMREVNALAVAKGVRTYFVRLSGASLFLGPYVVPHKLPCFSCYADRVEANTTFIKEFRAKTAGGEGAPPFGAMGGDSILRGGLRFHLSLDLIWNILGRIDEDRTFDVREINLATGDTNKAPLLRAPRCETCGRGRRAAPQWAVRDLL